MPLLCPHQHDKAAYTLAIHNSEICFKLSHDFFCYQHQQPYTRYSLETPVQWQHLTPVPELA